MADQHRLMAGAIAFYLEQVLAAEDAYYVQRHLVVRDPVIILAGCVTEAVRALDLRFVGSTPEGMAARDLLIVGARHLAIEEMKLRGMWR